MSSQEVIAAIRANHLKANVSNHPASALLWHKAWVERGGTIFGPGPYLHVPVDWEGERIVIRVYPPERLRRKLAKAWRP